MGEENKDKKEIEICPDCGEPFDKHDFDKFNDEDLEKFSEDMAKEFTKEAFPQIWRNEKEGLKEMSRKDVCEEMFFRGAVEMLYSYIKENEDFDENELWEEGGFVKKINPENMQTKMRTFSMEHNEEMNFTCKNCKVKISAHNNDWHEGLCDKCFDTNFNDGEVHIEGS